MIAGANTSNWLPQAASTYAHGVDGAFHGIYFVGVLVVILIAGLAVTFVKLSGPHGTAAKDPRDGRAHPLLQALWVMGAVAVAGYAFMVGLPGFLDRNAAPWLSYQVGVIASNDGYMFLYPNGHVADTLHVAVGRPVLLNLSSMDAIHSLTVPALRVNQAILPDRGTQAWFTATTPGRYDLRSSIHGGARYRDMRSAVVAQAPADFEAWMQSVTDIFVGRTMEQAGEVLYNAKGCKACHSLDGSRLVGPSFKDMYGFEFDTREGVRITVDDAYVKESILTPAVSVIAGFEPVMTPYAGNITDREIEALTAWMKTVSAKGGAAAPPDSSTQGGK